MANMLNEKLELPGMRVDVRPRDLKNTNGWRKAPWSQILSIRTDDGSRFFEWMVKSRYKMIDLIRFGFDCRIRDQTIELVSRFLSDR
jgi:hypothetical protein